MQSDPALKRLLDDARGLVGARLETIQSFLGPAAQEEQEDQYQNLDNVSSMENHEAFPATLFMREGRVELVYIPAAGLRQFHEGDLRALMVTDPVCLPSRAGKHANLLVYAGEGIACSAGKQGLHYLEVFPPRSLQAYRESIYRDPGPFIR